MTQKENIIKHLEEKGAITALEALDLYGCFRLAARIHELEKEGRPIVSEPYVTSGGSTISKYRLATNEPELFALT